MGRAGYALGAGAAALLVSASPIAVHAQARAPSANTVEEVVVTARRVEENVQTTPVSVAAFSAATLEHRSVDQLQDITRIVPAVRFVGEGNTAGTVIQMRGLGAPPAGSGGPAVQLYFQDVPIIGFGSSVPTYDIASLQVLRGPQGTLFGRNTLGGAVLVYPVLPTFQQDGYVKASGGNHDYYALEGAANLTVVPDVLAVRVSGQLRRRDGFIKSIETPNVLGDLDNVHTDSLRVSVLFQPMESFKNVLVLDYFSGKETGSPSILINPAAQLALLGPAALGYGSLAQANAAVSALAACDHRCVDYGPNNNIFLRREFFGLYNTTTYDFDENFSLKNIFGYRKMRANIAIDSDATPSPSFNVETFNPNKLFSEEFQLLANGLNDKLHVILGGFYQKTDRFGPLGISFPAIPFALTTGNTGDTKALYGNVNYSVTDKFRVSAGYRYTWDRQTFCNGGPSFGQTAANSFDQCEQLAATAPPGFGIGIVRQKAEAPTWSIGADYQATDDLFVYVVSRRGYRSGGVNGVFNTNCTTGGGPTYTTVQVPGSCLDFGFATTGTPSGRSVDLRPFTLIQPETLTDQEIGVRSDWNFGGWRQRLNVTGYHYVYNNVAQLLQLGVPASPPFPVLTPGDPSNPGLGSVVFNGGKVRVYGVETDLTLAPTDSLTLNVAATYTDQRQVKSATPPAGFDPRVFPPVNLPTARWATTVALRYVTPFRPLNGEVVLNADYFYTARFQAQSLSVPSYELVNMRVEWNDIGGRPVSAGVFARNLFDKTYILSPVNLAAGIANYGEPRMYGVDLTYRFK